VVRVFLWLGAAGFGGPAAHLAMMEAEIVRRRAWLAADEFLDLLGLTNLIPGPNSTEMAMALGYRRAGWPGLLVGGASFIAPAATITALLAWAYVSYGTRPAIQPWLAGLAPAVVGIIAAAAVTLARPLVTDVRRASIAIVALAAALFGTNEIAVLVGSGVLGLLWRPRGPAILSLLLAAVVPLGMAAAAPVLEGPARASLQELGWFFLRTGGVLYGGGYVLAALLQPLAHPLGWMTTRELLDAVAAGQVTPGPVLTTATFVGFVIHGWSGAAVATAAIFAPAFVGVAILMRVLDRVRGWAPARRVLDGVSAGAWALVAAVTLSLAREGLGSHLSLAVAIGAFVASLLGANAGLVVLAGLGGRAAWQWLVP
jgi:chromate transporter